MFNQRIFWQLGVAVALLVTTGIQSVRADIATSFLTNGNDAISGFAGPYGEVTIDRTTSTTATITFTSLTNGGNIYLFGDGSTVAVNTNATSFTVTGVTGSNSGTGFTPGPYTVVNPPGTSQVDGFGLFNTVIDSFDGFTHSSDTVSFTLTNTSGTWASAANVLTNVSGFDAAAHIFVTSSPADASNGAIATGFAAESQLATVVPAPPSLMLLVTGAVSLLGYGWRRRKLALA